MARIADLDRPALVRLAGGSIAIGLPPRRGWARARFVAVWTCLAAALVAGLVQTYVYLDMRSKNEIASASAERDRIAAEKKELIRQLEKAPSAQSTAFVRTNDFLRGLTRDKLSPFFAQYPTGSGYAATAYQRADDRAAGADAVTLAGVASRHTEFGSG